MTNDLKLEHPEQVDSPALLVYPERVAQNIRRMIRLAGDPERLIPHVKTHKMPAIVKLQMDAGIRQFKCATIAEAEMLAETGVPGVLIAYQLPVTKVRRLLQLIRRYPETQFASLLDNRESAVVLDELFSEEGLRANVWIDVDNGMHRTGHPVDEDLLPFYEFLMALPHTDCRGLHVYDGHIHDARFEDRRRHCEEDFNLIEGMMEDARKKGLPGLKVIAGGSPTFTVHSLYKERLCSPGTCLLWDEGYRSMLAEQPFMPAAALLTRIISKPVQGLLTTDLGHKAVAAENPLDKRIRFPELTRYEVLSQSEEHLVLKVEDETWQQYKTGDVLYGIPYHICPTVALYDEAVTVENGKVTGQWPVTARRRKISV